MLKKINFLLIHGQDGYTGAPYVFSNLVKSILSSTNTRVTLIYIKTESGFLKNLAHPRLTSINVQFPFLNVKSLRLASYFYLSCVAFIYVLRSLAVNRRFQYSILNTIPTLIFLPAAHLLRIKTISYLHELSLTPRIMSFLFLKINKIFAYKSVCVSKSHFSRLARFLPASSDVIYNSCSPQDEILFQKIALQNTSKMLSSPLIISMASSSNPGKGLFSFMQLALKAHQLSEYSNLRFKLHLSLGGMHKPEDLLKMLATLINVDLSQLHNLDIFFDSSIEKIFSETNLFLNLSDPEFGWFETFGLTCLQASCCAIPTIVSYKDCGPSEIIDDNYSGFHCDVGNIDQILSFISLYFNEELYRTFASNALKSSKKYSFSNFSANWRALFNI